MNESKRWQLNRADVQKWLKNAGIFLAPLALIYLAFVKANLADGMAVTDFVPNEVVIGAMTLYLVNVLTDLFLKLKKGETE